ncbi:MAG TPA: glutamate-5-semialdehyde dehydrogenase [Candidatus Paceibacterota bacterium]
MNLQKIKQAALRLSQTTEAKRNLFLKNLSRALFRNRKKIIAANVKDRARAKTANLPTAFIERLVLDEKGVQHLTAKLKSLVRLKSGLGEVIEKTKQKNGLVLKKIRTPLGVLAVIYEARPEVTIDVAALCIKSGNAAILKGGSEALSTNKALYECIRIALRESNLPVDALYFIATGNRKVTDALLKRHDVIDLVIARGGYGMVRGVMEKSNIPVLAHAAGGARIYVDKSADLEMAEKIIVNAKITKPAACNSVDTILVHRAIARTFVPKITNALHRKDVAIVNGQWDTEFLALKVGIQVVKDSNEAIAFINQHTKKHTEGIIATDTRVIRDFVNGIDAAALFVNCSTRLHDGYVFGLGSEMGISTSKLHARGPVGLKELTTYKWEMYGTGNIRT